jgi:hypothetical protein
MLQCASHGYVNDTSRISSLLHAVAISSLKRRLRERRGRSWVTAKANSPSLSEHPILGCLKGAMPSPCWLRCLYRSGH